MQESKRQLLAWSQCQATTTTTTCRTPSLLRLAVVQVLITLRWFIMAVFLAVRPTMVLDHESHERLEKALSMLLNYQFLMKFATGNKQVSLSSPLALDRLIANLLP